jgi:hypothetical protein
LIYKGEIKNTLKMIEKELDAWEKSVYIEGIKG